MLFVGERLHLSLDDVGEMDPEELMLWREYFRQVDEARDKASDFKAELRAMAICDAAMGGRSLREIGIEKFFPVLLGSDRAAEEITDPAKIERRMMAWCKAFEKPKPRKELS